MTGKISKEMLKKGNKKVRKWLKNAKPFGNAKKIEKTIKKDKKDRQVFT